MNKIKSINNQNIKEGFKKYTLSLHVGKSTPCSCNNPEKTPVPHRRKETHCPSTRVLKKSLWRNNQVNILF